MQAHPTVCRCNAPLTHTHTHIHEHAHITLYIGPKTHCEERAYTHGHHLLKRPNKCYLSSHAFSYLPQPATAGGFTAARAASESASGGSPLPTLFAVGVAAFLGYQLIQQVLVQILCSCTRAHLYHICLHTHSHKRTHTRTHIHAHTHAKIRARTHT